MATIKIVAAKGYHCNLEYPWKVKPSSADGISFSKEIYGREDAVKMGSDEVVFAVSYVNPGKPAKISAELKMAFCDDRLCYNKKVLVHWPAN